MVSGNEAEPTALKTSSRRGLIGSVTRFARNAAFGRGVAHSALFGGLCGVGLWGILIAGRVVKLTLFDDEWVPLQSRERYLEKQLLFYEEEDRAAKANILAQMVQEYNPVHARPPTFASLDSRPAMVLNATVPS